MSYFLFIEESSELKFQKQPPEVFCKRGVLRNFTKFTGKHLCQSLFFNKVAGKHLCQSLFFNIVAGLRPATLLKKRPWHRYFPVNFVKFLRTPLLQNTSERLLLDVLRNFAKFTSKHLCQSIFLNKISGEDLPARVISCELCKILRTSFLRTLVAASVSVPLQSFFRKITGKHH